MKILKKLNTAQIIALGYLLVILTGALILMLPICTKGDGHLNFIDALFRATTSTCVTGLVLNDTYTTFSLFGQIIILLLIQIGGIGFMTVISLMGLFIKRKMSISEQKVIMQASGTITLSDTLKMIKKVILATVIFETIGALLLMIRFIPKLGVSEGIYSSIFHSVSAFCNSGIDLMGRFGKFSSLTTFYNDYLVNFTICMLIITGGLGFLVWSDLYNCKFNYKKLQLHTKIVIVSTLILLFVPTVLFYIFERNNALQDMNFFEGLMCSFFQSTTTRTAGFNTIELTSLSDSSILMTIVLMLIGGSPGSTAGGIKTTTFVVLLISIAYTFKKKTNITIGKRQLEDGVQKQASALLLVYLSLIIVSTIIICYVDNQFSLKEVLFETTSAVGTVGLSLGITPNLGFVSKLVIIVLMYMGRIGGITMILLFENKKEEVLQRPTEKILIG